jgi:hypothetical protein
MKDLLESLVPGVTRIRDADGFIGTVVYVGPVASAKNEKEVYAGIVWDDKSRGLHDGSVVSRQTNRLVRYFSCEASQGSFLRLSKLDLGVCLDVELMTSKYVLPDAPLVAPNNVLPHTATTVRGNAKPIEFLGELQIRAKQQLEDLDKISLRRMGISTCSSDLGSHYSHLNEIDLAGNLLCQWETVLFILQQFPRLEKLNLASNRIQNVPPRLLTSSSELPACFEIIKVLNLNDCALKSYESIEWIGKSMPKLEELCVAYSDLSDFHSFTFGTGFKCLKLLDCSSCNIDSWDELRKIIGQLPCLESLSLNDNPISSINPVASTSESYFPALKSLQIAGTEIENWTDIQDGLNQLTLLQSLRFRNVPLIASMSPAEARALIIARFPRVNVLNGSIISDKERTDAERRYVTFIARELLQEGSELPSSYFNENNGTEEKQNGASLYPQFQVLLQKHKEYLGDLTGHGASFGTTSEHPIIVNVIIKSMAPGSCTKDPLIRRLPGSLQVGRLKALCARAFDVDIELQTLHFQSKVITYSLIQLIFHVISLHTSSI